MNKDSIEIIKKHIKPDEELITKTKETLRSKGKKIHPIRIGVAACFILLICATAGLVYSEKDVLKDTTHSSEVSTTNTDKENIELIYSELIDINTPADEDVVGYNHTEMLDVAAFNESMLKESVAIIEGTVIDMRLKEYVIVSEFDKFSSGGKLTEKINTLIYKVNIKKVWYGNLQQNQIIEVEDQNFSCDEIISMKNGHSYVLALCMEDDEIWHETDGKLISGNIKRESTYSTIYPFQPQIEITDSGYVFSNDWKTLVTDEAVSVVMDVELGENAEYYRDKMLFVSKEVFAERFQMLIDIWL